MFAYTYNHVYGKPRAPIIEEISNIKLKIRRILLYWTLFGNHVQNQEEIVMKFFLKKIWID
jgi:hypothetical protein